MRTLSTGIVIVLILMLAAFLTWGLVKATQDLTVVVAQGIGNISDASNQ